MRLIDADNIKDTDISFYLGTRYESHLADFRDLLNEQPTIQAIPISELYNLKEKKREFAELADFDIYLDKIITYIESEGG